MKRQQILESIKLAIAEGDKQTATRLYVEHRLSRQAFDEACAQGEALKRTLNGRKASHTTYAKL